MVNITHKSGNLRQAIATAIVEVSSQSTIDAIIEKKIPKGDVFEFSRAAGLLGIKRTSDVIPDCHPLPVEYAAITYRIDGLQVHVTVEVQTIYKTGVEVEAMHGAAVTALTMYDMLKPIDKHVEISTIKLLSKKGGKTDFNAVENPPLKIAVLVCSDSVSAGQSEDLSGKTIIDRLAQFDLPVSDFKILPDEAIAIKTQVLQWSKEEYQMVLVSGGTGLSDRDVTYEAIHPLIDREIRGISETVRDYGQQRTPYAMLSRSVAGFVAKTLVITMPGSVNGVKDTINALFPQVLHVFKVVSGTRHEEL
jgi:molybdenum cofactor biosynthesis protein MoaC